MITLLYINCEAGIMIIETVSPDNRAVPPFVGIAGPVVNINGSARHE
jgi:hypothetical protein